MENQSSFSIELIIKYVRYCTPKIKIKSENIFSYFKFHFQRPFMYFWTRKLDNNVEPRKENLYFLPLS